jgi:transglutaminase-like putative cysteine protease
VLFNLSDDFQKVISTNPLIVEIHTGTIDSSACPNVSQYLAADPFLQVIDPRIVEASSRIVGNETSRAVEAQLLGHWVFESIKKDYTVSLPSAVDVLTVKKGDCNEHTALYTALARAAGIPTKMCIGLVYKDGIFYYHAWPAVYLGGWTPIDPTFGQDRADATHLKLIEGGFERQADLMRIVGKIKIKVLDNPKEL